MGYHAMQAEKQQLEELFQKEKVFHSLNE